MANINPELIIIDSVEGHHLYTQLNSHIIPRVGELMYISDDKFIATDVLYDLRDQNFPVVFVYVNKH